MSQCPRVGWWFRWSVLTLAAVTLVGCGPEKALPHPLLTEMVAASGVDQFDRVDQIDFTFNVQSGERHTRRTWSWRPKSELVDLSYVDEQGVEQRVRYHRDLVDELAADHLVTADRWFINDTFWLLMPLHLSWNPYLRIEDLGPAPTPVKQSIGRHAIVHFPDEGGYTPGDVYEIWLNDEGLIQAWIFRRGGATDPTLVNTFEAYRTFEPLRIAMEHVNADGTFRLWFTDVTVRTR